MANETRNTPRPSLDFEMVGIRLGDTLALYDTPDQTCVVVGLTPPRVLYQDRSMSLTEAVNAAYEAQHNDPAGAWCFGDETLRQRRERFESYYCR